MQINMKMFEYWQDSERGRVGTESIEDNQWLSAFDCDNRWERRNADAYFRGIHNC